MDDNKYRKFYVDWWNIRKSTIYALVAIVLVGGSATGVIWWASKNNWFVQTASSDIPKDAAQIVSFEGEVRITRAATRETILVTKVTWVTAGDTIQTLSDGRAMVRMIDGSIYSVRPNSTVVVADTTSFLGGKNVRVRVNDGQLNVRTDDQPNDAKNIVELGESENQLMPKTDASFNTNGPNGGEIRISRGGVETSLGGETTTLGENEYASVNGQKLSAREKLLAPPRPSSPGNSEQILDTGSGANVTFTWQDPEGNAAASFYLQISRSPTFASDAILADRTGMQTHEYRLAGLAPGDYYWRLKATSKTGQTTNWNEPAKFSVVKRGDSIAIDANDWKVENVGGNVYLVIGKTLPGMNVRSQGRGTFSASDGSFKLQINSPSIEAPIEISDDRGNRAGFVLSLRSGTVLRRF